MRARGAARWAVGGLALSLLLACGEGERRPRHLLLIVADDLGVMDVGAYNPDSFYETPAIDRLASEGRTFLAGYAASPVCSPTRLALLTGRHPTRVGATNWFSGARADRFEPAEFVDRMELREETLAEALRDAGYATHFAGKWHLGAEPELWPEHQGFDINRGGHAAGGPYGGKRYFSPYGNPRLEDGPDGEHLPERLARETSRFIRSTQERGDQPFFAMLSFYSVHTPLLGRPDLVEKYERRRAGLATGEIFGDEEQVWQTTEARRVRLIQEHAVYAAMVEAMDEAVGQVLATLDELELADDTLVIFTSDNGGLSTSEGHPTSNLPLRGGKGWLYEGGIRVPFIVRGAADIVAGSTSQWPVVSYDVYPTVLDLLGLEAKPDQHVDGVSLAPDLAGEKEAEDRALFFHYPHYGNQGGFPGAVMREGRYKLLERLTDGRLHLYDLEADPGERHDLARDRPELAARMRGRLHDWYLDVDARFLRQKAGGPPPWAPESQRPVPAVD